MQSKKSKKNTRKRAERGLTATKLVFPCMMQASLYNNCRSWEIQHSNIIILCIAFIRLHGGAVWSALEFQGLQKCVQLYDLCIVLWVSSWLPYSIGNVNVFHNKYKTEHSRAICYWVSVLKYSTALYWSVCNLGCWEQAGRDWTGMSRNGPCRQFVVCLWKTMYTYMDVKHRSPWFIFYQHDK